MSKILIADDQNDVLEALRILLKGEGHQTDAVTSLAGIFQALDKRKGREGVAHCFVTFDGGTHIRADISAI